MEASKGERLRPLPARDARGRFTTPSGVVIQVESPKPPPSMEVLLWRFDLTGSCRFPDPWRRKGWYVIETRQSLKGFPVAMRYEGPLLKKSVAGVIKYNMRDFGGRWGNLPDGEVAVSPMPWFGDPTEGWGFGSWESGTRETKRQLAALYIHLAHSVDLHTKSCGNKIGILNRERY